MISARIAKVFPARPGSTEFRLDVVLEARPGITVIFGASGCGKSLTLDCIAGFVRPDEGRILIDDRIVFDSGAKVSLKPQERDCGYVFQSYALFPHMSVRDNLMFGAARLPRIERTRRVNEMIERFSLGEFAGRRPHELSGGQKQRCSIARSLVNSPKILLLDEPARGLDAPLRMDFYAVLRQVREQYETPILLVTHSIEECFELGEQMIVMDGGRVVQKGTPAEVLSRPATLALADLMGLFNMFPVEIRALDPSRNASILRWGDYDIQCEYIPAHLKGDRVQLLATPRQLHARPRIGRLEPNQVPVELLRAIETTDCMRLEFAGGFTVEIPKGSLDRNNGDWVIEFPQRGLRVL